MGCNSHLPTWLVLFIVRRRSIACKRFSLTINRWVPHLVACIQLSVKLHIFLMQLLPPFARSFLVCFCYGDSFSSSFFLRFFHLFFPVSFVEILLSATSSFVSSICFNSLFLSWLSSCSNFFLCLIGLPFMLPYSLLFSSEIASYWLFALMHLIFKIQILKVITQGPIKYKKYCKYYIKKIPNRPWVVCHYFQNGLSSGVSPFFFSMPQVYYFLFFLLCFKN